MTPEQRRAAFINDIVEVCKRHRVLLDIDGVYDWQPISFAEAKHDKHGLAFNVDLAVIESAVREAVWPIVQGDANKI